jgi:Domain of unknown function (DUF4326)
LRNGEECVRRHRAWLIEAIAIAGYWRNELDGLRGKNLACWCGDDEPCHVDPLLELATADMPRRQAKFTQSEIARAVRGALAAGLPVAGVQVEGGRIVVLTEAPPAGRDECGARDAADVVDERLGHAQS